MPNENPITEAMKLVRDGSQTIRGVLNDIRQMADSLRLPEEPMDAEYRVLEEAPALAPATQSVAACWDCLDKHYNTASDAGNDASKWASEAGGVTGSVKEKARDLLEALAGAERDMEKALPQAGPQEKPILATLMAENRALRKRISQTGLHIGMGTVADVEAVHRGALALRESYYRGRETLAVAMPGSQPCVECEIAASIPEYIEAARAAGLEWKPILKAARENRLTTPQAVHFMQQVRAVAPSPHREVLLALDRAFSPELVAALKP